MNACNFEFAHMSERHYWSVINGGINKSFLAHYNQLKNKMWNDDLMEVFDFDLYTKKFSIQLFSERMMCASVIIHESFEESTLLEFIYFIISRGELVYNDALKDPDLLVRYLNKFEETGEPFLAPEFKNVAKLFYNDRFGGTEEYYEEAREYYKSTYEILNPIKLDLKQIDFKNECPKLFAYYN